MAELDHRSLRYAKLRTQEAHVVGLCGDIDSARRILDEAAAIHRAISQTEVFLHERDIRGGLETIGERFDLAEAALTDLVEEYDREGERFYASTAVAMLASAIAQRGGNQEAIRLAEEADELAAPDDWWVQCISGIARAHVAVNVARLADALARSQAATKVADEHEVVSLRIEARMARARALTAAGETAQAEAILMEARGLARGYGSVLEDRRAQRALEHLPER